MAATLNRGAFNFGNATGAGRWAATAARWMQSYAIELIFVESSYEIGEWRA